MRWRKGLTIFFATATVFSAAFYFYLRSIEATHTKTQDAWATAMACFAITMLLRITTRKFDTKETKGSL
jgi:hypothetical protein